MDTCPHEFTDLQKNTNEDLTKCCDMVLMDMAETVNPTSDIVKMINV